MDWTGSLHSIYGVLACKGTVQPSGRQNRYGGLERSYQIISAITIILIGFSGILSGVGLFIAIRGRPFFGFGLLVSGVFAAFASLQPGTVSSLSKTLGVGRGADLVLYSFVTIGTLVLLYLILKTWRLEEELREVAIRSSITLEPLEINEPGKGNHDPSQT